MDIDFDFESGFAPEDMEERLQDVLEEGNENLEQAITDVTLETEADTRRRAPVDNNNLRPSYESEVEVDGDTITGTVGTNTHYAVHVEYGTVKMDAQPHLRPAVDQTMRRYEPEVIEAVMQAVESASE